MYLDKKIWLALSDKRIELNPKMLNRHGMIAGATGTGKTITIKVLAESLSEAGIPVFLADVKGDLASLALPGADNPNMIERRQRFGLSDDIFKYSAFPVNFWDLYTENGMPLRTTVSEVGPLMLARMLGLNDVQEGVLSIIFRYADDNGLLLLDLKDLRALMNVVSERASELQVKYGNISPASVGAIARSLLVLENAGGDHFFGEPALQLTDFLQVATTGQAFINILDATKLFLKPALYSSFMLWLLSELFEVLPEVGDLDKPKLVFFFDEAHLLFDEMPKQLLQKIEQVVKLIRSKGVGVFFITQNPSDIPGEILAQLGNKVQHALRAYTPAEQKAVKAAANSFRVNAEFDTETVLTELATGEAIVSVLDEKGIPTVAERCFILPPKSQFGTLDPNYRALIINTCPLNKKYGQMIDRESAYEMLTSQMIQENDAAARAKFDEQKRKDELAQKKLEIEQQKLEAAQQREYDRKLKAEQAAEEKRLKEEARKADLEERKAYRNKQSSVVTKITNSAVTTVGREVGRSLIRGILGSFKR